MRRLAIALFVMVVAVARGDMGLSEGLTPQNAVEKMTFAEGLKVSLFASEPEVRQPIFVKCDDRGRVWTIQYLQYPNPAGLERVKIDRWSRTVYDRVPLPPPRGPRGADRITILEDVDGDGHADKAKDFIDGLNLVTGVEFGHGGVFVLNVPYLLFYQDADRNDVPDADPEVLLTGFGMEDAQAMSNHLTWGPDGWLYGVNGSTTTCRIRGIEFQQGVWRYHPVTRKFELFCEGGSNCYGLTFDHNGELYYSTNGGPFVHGMQGAYYYKSFGKHGPLHNLFAYHFFPELERDQAPGGPPTGGTMYLADAFPEPYRGTFIAGNFLGHTVSWWRLDSTGSTVHAAFGGVLLDSHDAWFGPTDVCLAPDGSMYVSDFYDERTAHPDPDAKWDRSNGRIFKLAAASVEPAQVDDVASLTSEALVDLLLHPNHWYANRARVELARRRDTTVAKRLRAMASQTADSRTALEGLWALHATTGIDDALTLELLRHPFPYVRFWTIRFVGDRNEASPKVARQLSQLAAKETDPVVRGQLASTAKRLSAATGLQIVDSLLNAAPEDADPRVPWLIWWAIEANAVSHPQLLVDMFARDATWANPAAKSNALRLVRRIATEGAPAAYHACLKLLKSTPPAELAAAHEQLRQGLAERSVGLQGIGQGGLFGQHAASAAGDPSAEVRRYEPLPDELKQYIAGVWQSKPRDAVGLELALRAGLDGVYPTMKAVVLSSDVDAQQRATLLGLLRELKRPEALPEVMELAIGDHPEAVQLAALQVLADGDNPEIATKLLAHYHSMSPTVRSRTRDVLFARPVSALEYLKLVDLGEIAAEEAPLDQLSRLASHKDETIDLLVRKHWGSIGPGSREEQLATMRRYNNDLRPGGGDPVNGKAMFIKHCAICHQLHGEGNKIGPDLTSANRQDREALLANIVDPSAVIRREYMNYVLVTDSGLAVSGLLAEQDGATVTILDARNQRIKVPRDEIESLEESEVSLMPERLLGGLTPQELRDLFAYVQETPETVTP
ncbi:MAG: c-type cytochrome [Pirellulales bacterium]|nr:c-type cytochrome [Pirellulales bacterium]